MGRTAVRIGLVGAMLLALTCVGAYAARVKVDGIILTADGSFTPSVLPKGRFQSITLRGHINISTPTHAMPPAIVRANVNFGDDGRVLTRGLPVCVPERIQSATPAQARKLCEKAIVGTGNIEALVRLPEQPQVPVRTPLTMFNGPPEGGNPTVVFHSHTSFPKPETYVVSAPILKPKGARRNFHVDIEIPPIAEGYGSITHADIEVNRKYRYQGRELSYTSARCPDGILEAHGRMTFANGTVIAGTIYRSCRAKQPGA